MLTQKGAIDHKNQFHDTLTIFLPLSAHLHLGALDPEHHPRIAPDGKSLILWLKDIHSEPYLLSLLDNFTSQVSTRAKEHGEQINSSFVESIAYLKKTLRTIDYGREKLINIR